GRTPPDRRSDLPALHDADSPAGGGSARALGGRGPRLVARALRARRGRGGSRAQGELCGSLRSTTRAGRRPATAVLTMTRSRRDRSLPDEHGVRIDEPIEAMRAVGLARSLSGDSPFAYRAGKTTGTREM